LAVEVVELSLHLDEEWMVSSVVEVAHGLGLNLALAF
jgi:hypothetical protein